MEQSSEKYDEEVVGNAAQTLLRTLHLLESARAKGMPHEQKSDIAAAALERFRFACIIQSFNLVVEMVFTDRVLPKGDPLVTAISAHMLEAVEHYNEQGRRLKELVTLIPGIDWESAQRPDAAPSHGKAGLN